MSKYKIDKTLKPQTQEYMKVLVKKLKGENGEIDEVWNAFLYLISKNYDMIIECDEDISKLGLTTVGRSGIIQNPLVKVRNDAQIQLFKLLDSFLLTKKSSLKSGDEIEEDDSPLTSYFKDKNKR